MKKISIFIIGTFFMISTALLAHPPKSIDIQYDKTSGKVSIVVIHGISDVKKHFIEAVVVSSASRDVKKIELSQQSSPESEILVVDYPGVKSGEKISVKASCNIFGSKTAEIIVK